MKKVFGAAVLAMALVGCGVPMEGEDAETGAAQQELDTTATPRPTTPQVDKSLLKNPQDKVVGAPAFQTQMHLTDPIHQGGGCH